MRAIQYCLMLFTIFYAVHWLEAITHEYLAGIMLILAVQFFQILVHETSHAITASRLGCRVRTLAAMPLSLDIATRQITLAKRPLRGDIGGYVIFGHSHHWSPAKLMVVAAAGPCADIVLGTVCLLSQALLASGLAQELCRALASLAFGSALINLIPVRQSDGAQVLSGLRYLSARR